jgi:hypothetical protein
MKNYYYNQKTQDLLIFDTEGNEILVLERLTGIRVFTSSELHDPAKVSHDQNFNQEAPVKVYKKHLSKANKRKCGKCGKPGHRSDNCEKFVSDAPAPRKKGRSGKWKCKNCGELGHSAKTCTKPPKIASSELPDGEVDAIVKEERALETV